MVERAALQSVHPWVHKRIDAGELSIQQMDVQTYFFRRQNINARRARRTDHLLWHHAAHTVDLFAYQAGSPVIKANVLQGPVHDDGYCDGYVDSNAG